MGGGEHMKRTQKRVFLFTFLLTGVLLLSGVCIGKADVVCRHMEYADGQTFYKTHLRPMIVWEKPVCKFADLWYNHFVNIICPEALED